MSNTPDDRRYTKEHEWAQPMGDGVFRIGITEHAQDQLGDVVFVEVPEVGAEVVKDEPVGVVESVKTVSDLYSPLSGEVTAINEELEEYPERVNESAFDAGWIYELKASDDSELEALMDAAAYAELVAEG